MDNDKLNSIFNDVHKNHFPRRLRRVYAEFYPNRSLRHSVEWNGLRIKARVSALLQEAPIHVIESLALMLFARVYRKKVSRDIRLQYRSFTDQLAIKRTSRNMNYDPRGIYFNLIDIFDSLNRHYFKNELSVAEIGWSLGKSYSRLGFYDKRRNLIVISRIFDSPDVPENIVEYLMYHEMLHIKHPEINTNGRRQIHTRAFRQSEELFPAIEEIRKWLKLNVTRL